MAGQGGDHLNGRAEAGEWSSGGSGGLLGQGERGVAHEESVPGHQQGGLRCCSGSTADPGHPRMVRNNARFSPSSGQRRVSTMRRDGAPVFHLLGHPECDSQGYPRRLRPGSGSGQSRFGLGGRASRPRQCGLITMDPVPCGSGAQ